MSNEREKYIDIAKGISIISVILGHLGNDKMNCFLYTFHVPMFYFITGYFTNTNLTINTFARKRMKKLLIPYLYTSVIIIFLGMLEYKIFFGSERAIQAASDWTYAAIYGSGSTYETPFWIKSIGPIWFLWATFWGGLF